MLVGGGEGGDQETQNHSSSTSGDLVTWGNGGGQRRGLGGLDVDGG